MSPARSNTDFGINVANVAAELEPSEVVMNGKMRMVSASLKPLSLFSDPTVGGLSRVKV